MFYLGWLHGGHGYALDMAKYVSESFIKYKEKYNFDYDKVYAVRITGNDKDPNGKYPNLEKFSDIESNDPIVVTTSKLLTTGIDVKTVRNIVIFRNIGSMVEFKQIIGRGTRTYPHPDKHKEKLGFFILEYANLSTDLFNDPDWDDKPSSVIDEGSIDIATEIAVSEAGSHESDSTEDIKAASVGIYEEPPEDEGQIRYRMSEEFLRGNVKIVAESVSFTGLDGKPLTPEKFVLYQSEVLKNQFSQFHDLNVLWQDNKTRREFVEEKATDLGLNIEALHQVFFAKHGMRDVDTLDVISNLIFGNDYLTKDERIAKSRALNEDFYKGLPAAVKPLIDDLYAVYRNEDFKPFILSKELWQTPGLKKYGAIGDIQKLVGGDAALMKLVGDLQAALYDERIAA
jgi:type I restriction enzyme R subunit